MNKASSGATTCTSTRRISPPADAWSPPARAARYVRRNKLHVYVYEQAGPPLKRARARSCPQVMAQFTVPVPGREVADATDAVTLGEALEAAAQTSAGDKPVDLADAAAVQAAETRATGLGGNVRGGVAAAAQRAAETNARRAEDGGKVTLRDVVGGGAEAGMPANKVATREDAREVAAAAARNAGKGHRAGGGGGVAEAVVAAADMNEGRMV